VIDASDYNFASPRVSSRVVAMIFSFSRWAAVERVSFWLPAAQIGVARRRDQGRAERRPDLSITQFGGSFFMKKFVHPLVALMILALGVVIVPSAQAKAAPASYTPVTGALFNNPNGTGAEQLTLMTQVMNAVNSVPAGSTIRIAAYSFGHPTAHEQFADDLVKALIAAKGRGVQVRLLIDSAHYRGADTPQLAALRKALGTDRSKASYIRTCKYGCMSSKTSYMHSKLYLFSRVGNAKYVSMISSANPADTGIKDSWNNTYTIVNNKTLYDANVDNFKDMLPDRTNTNYYHTVEGGSCEPAGNPPATCKLYYFPRAGSTPSSDTIYNILSDVTCTGAADGYGDVNGKTVIRLSAYAWTPARLYIAQKLTELKGKGCNIQVVYPADNVDAKVASELRKKNIAVYNGRIDRNSNGVNDLYPHSKYLLINGVYKGDPKAKIVYTASQNFTGNSLRQSNEVMLRIPIDSVYDQYFENFNLMKDYIVNFRSAAKTTAGVDSASEKRALSDDSPDPDE
jgi:PLD-like domain